MPDTAALTRELPCPSCGYDLRAMTGDRCPECGADLDRAALHVSAIPWAHRRQIGRVRAYLKTAWMFVRGSKLLRDEPLRPQSLADASRFARVTGTILAMLIAGAWCAVGSKGKVYASLAYDHPPAPMWGMPPPPPAPPEWQDDVWVPWSAGLTLPWVAPVAAILMGFHLAGVQRTVFRARGRTADVRRAAAALAAYMTAPLLLLVPAALVFWTMRWLAGSRSLGPYPEAFVETGLKPAYAIAGALALWAVAGTLYRVGQWLGRTTGATAGRVAVGLGELLLLWAVGLGLLGFALPWLVGFVRLWVDSVG